MAKVKKSQLDIDWININDGLPREDESVLITNGDVVDLGFIHEETWYGLKHVTHWAALPGLIKKEDR
jgi:hypothetical protein